MRADANHRFPGLNRLGQIVDGAGVKPLQLALQLSGAAHEQRRTRPCPLICLERATHLEPAHVGHIHIDYNQVGRLVLCLLQRVTPSQ